MAMIDQEQWIRIKNQGRAKYLLIHWVLSAAVPVALVLPIMKGLISGQVLSYFLSAGFFKSLVLSLILCTVISLIAGNRKWNKNEKLYALKT